MSSDKNVLLRKIEEIDFKILPVHSYYWSLHENEKNMQKGSEIKNPSQRHSTNFYLPQKLYKPITCFFRLNKKCHGK
jgi:hypothetical protein